MARNTRVAAAVALSSGAAAASGPVGDRSWVHAMADNRTDRARAEWYDRMEKPRFGSRWRAADAHMNEGNFSVLSQAEIKPGRRYFRSKGPRGVPLSLVRVSWGLPLLSLSSHVYVSVSPASSVVESSPQVLVTLVTPLLM